MDKIFKGLFQHTRFCLVLFIITFSFSCVNTKRAAYFYGVTDTTIRSPYTRIPEPVIQRNDILTISVSSPNPEADIIFNAPNLLATATGNAGGGTIGNQTSGYLVNPEGFIQFPVIGNLKVAGLTKSKIKDLIAGELVSRKLSIDPVISVRIINFRVTVMGEVRNPTVVTTSSEKLSLLEAVGMAGDLTVFAKRDNILLIREENDEKIIRRINLNSTDFLNSQYYYLKSNDVVYVEANAARLSSAERSMQILPIALSSISVLAVIVGLILR
ncbi:MAG: polysaccharide biosynthesis/export family protein [Agriterribacter sp.]